MKPKHNASKIVKRIINAARMYQQDVVNKTFLILYEGRSIEVLFKTENFLHLCGVDSSLYAKDFYRKAVKGQLKEKEVSFSKTHPFVFADIKTNRLPDALALLKRDSLLITEVSTQSKIYKLGTTDLEVVVCFDSQIGNNGYPVNDILIPYSLRVEEIDNKRFKDIYEVDFVLSKQTGVKEYYNIEYGDSKRLEQYISDNNIDKYSIHISLTEED